jgi:drug/metabolite transporter (DMT)-like permease
VASRAGSERRAAGIALCVASACGFGLMAIFATRAYAAGLGVTTLLALRFALAATVFWAIVLGRGRRGARIEASIALAGADRAARSLAGRIEAAALAGPSETARSLAGPIEAGSLAGRGDAAHAGAGAAGLRPSRRVLLTALALGAGYSAQSGFFFSALRHIDAGLTSLLLYTFPAMVCVGSVALGRERLGPWKAGALGLASAGTALVLLGGGSGGLQLVGVLLGLGAGVTYTVYILVAADVVGAIDAWLFSALVTTGAAVTVTLVGLATGSLVAPSPTGWLWIAAIALVCTVLPVSTFLLGLERVGGPTASIASTVEPVVTVSLAVALLGESFGPVQVAGATLVIGAIVALQSRRAEPVVSVVGDGAPPAAADLAAARAPASQAA